MPHAFTAESPEFHKELSELLLSGNKRINIIAPRGSAKTTFAGTLKVIHHMMFDEGFKMIILASRTQGHAVNILRTIKDILDYSEGFRALFGYHGQHSAVQWTENSIITKDFAIFTRGMGQMIRGFNIKSQRPTLLIGDDLQDESNTVTPEAVDKGFEWVHAAAEPSVDPLRGQMIVIGTPIVENCVVLSLKRMDGWVSRHYSYLLRDGKPVFELNDDREGLTSLWEGWKPVHKLLEELEDLKKIGRSSLFFKEKLCWITGDESKPIQRDMIQYYDGEVEIAREGAYMNMKDGRVIPVNIFMGVDPASSTSNRADYSVIFPVAVDADMNRYCLPYWRKRALPMDVGDAIVGMYNKYKPVRVKIESTGYQEFLRQYVASKQYIPGTHKSDSDTKPRTSKSKRLLGFTPQFATKKVFLRRDQTDFEHELLMWVEDSAHDDILDGYYYATLKMYPPDHEKPDAKQKPKQRFFRRRKEGWATA